MEWSKPQQLILTQLFHSWLPASTCTGEVLDLRVMQGRGKEDFDVMDEPFRLFLGCSPLFYKCPFLSHLFLRFEATVTIVKHLRLLSIVVINIITNSNMAGVGNGGKGLFQLWLYSITRGRPGQELRARTQIQATEGHCLLACSSLFAQPAFLCHPVPPAHGWHYPQWAGPSHINY